MGGGHLDAADLGAAALHDRFRVLDPLALQISHYLEIGNRPRTGLSRQRLHVVEVVEVAVGYEHGVELADPLQLFRGVRVVRQERVNYDLLVARRSEPERRVAEVSDPGSA